MSVHWCCLLAHDLLAEVGEGETLAESRVVQRLEIDSAVIVAPKRLNFANLLLPADEHLGPAVWILLDVLVHTDRLHGELVAMQEGRVVHVLEEPTRYGAVHEQTCDELVVDDLLEQVHPQHRILA